MDETSKSGNGATEHKECENDTGKKVETEETKSDSPSRTTWPDEAHKELTERLQPDSGPEDGDNLCTVCGFSAKCQRSLKIHYTRRHGSNSKKPIRMAKQAENCESISDASPAEVQQGVNLKTQSAAGSKQNQQPNHSDQQPASGENHINTKGLMIKESVSDKQQTDREETVQTPERRVSKRTPKPKMIHSCDYCGQEFWGKSPLDLHVQRYHTKNIPYTREYMLVPS